MKRLLVVGIAVLAVCAWGNAFAANITIPDESSSVTGWYGPQEDQEVEPNCITGQDWDLEGFFLNGNTLSMVGGYDFVNGVPEFLVGPGDLFLDANGGAQYGTGIHAPANYDPYEIVSDTFGYEYVMDMNFADKTFDIYNIANAGSALQLECNDEQPNDAANPWRWISGGKLVGSGVINYQTGLTDAQVAALGYDVIGGAHNVASMDISWLFPHVDGAFTSHFTMECGNDNLMGHAAVPEPATLLLLGLGLASAGLRKRFLG
jgi:hypothetical protein